MGNQKSREAIDEVVYGRVSSICNKECVKDIYIDIQNKLIETRKLLAHNLQNDKLQLLSNYDKLNNDISELIYRALYIEGLIDGMEFKI
ncbi:hypothetical protein [Ruminiclostridium cellobioparum]|jgi:hypothetical protein|uniref:Uncharacterized protein n=1 Tax=Ruminiclostridium cellobioparum subsp. termitidis CT1112 TaxID=1195236 RepID=S0FP23_RUMCE|nr:hypothetical protein [Ruminiclostridium cellobioparum]EMS70218.1 hypothetical protein CTER_3983 [Ruminiclostridium cellobioparum subsp. termitidis CT1112]